MNVISGGPSLNISADRKRCAEQETRDPHGWHARILTQLATKVDHAIIAHFLASPSFCNLKIDNKPLEGVSPLAFYEMVDNCLAEIELDAPHACLRKVRTGLQQLIHEIMCRKRFEGLPLTSAFQGQQFAKWMTERFAKLRVGERLLVNGGWSGRNASQGHMILYEWIKLTPDTFSLNLFNTGEGLEYHAVQFEQGKWTKKQKLFFPSIPQKTLEHRELWEWHFHALQNPMGGIQANHIYAGFLGNVIPDFPQALEKANRAGKKESYRRPQPAGVCVLESLLIYIKECYRDDPQAYKRLVCSLRWCFLKAYHQRLVNTNILTILPWRSSSLVSVESDFMKKSGIIQFFQTLLKRFSGDLHKLLSRRIVSITELERPIAWVQEQETFSQLLLEKIKTFRALDEPLAAMKVESQPLLVKEWKPASFPTSSKRVLVGSEVITDPPVWLSHSFAISQLNRWAAFAKERCLRPQASPYDQRETFRWIQRLFQGMPSAKSAFWSQCQPEIHELAMERLTFLSELLVGLYAGLPEQESERAVVEASLTKTLAVLTILGRSRLFQKSTFFLGSQLVPRVRRLSLEWTMPIERGDLRHSGDFFLKDPKWENDFCEAIEILLQASSSSSALFEENYAEGLNLTEELFSNQQLTTPRWIYEYLADPMHISILNVIKGTLALKMRSPGGKPAEFDDVPWRLIVAEAMSNPRYYLPKAFWTLQLQSSLINCVILRQRELFFLSESRMSPSFSCLFDIQIHADLTQPLPSSIPISATMKSNAMFSGYYFGEDAQLFPERFQLIPMIVSVMMEAHQRIPKGIEYDPDFWEWEHVESCLDFMQMPVKALAYYSKYLMRLNMTDNQFNLERSLFHSGLLREQLCHYPPFIRTLVKFVEEGYHYHVRSQNLLPSLFFLRMGYVFKQFSLEVLGKEWHEEIVRLPTVLTQWRELERVAKDKNNSRFQQIVIARELLAVHGKGAPILTPEGCTNALVQALTFNTYVPEQMSGYFSLYRVQEAMEGCKAIARFLKRQFTIDPESCSRILSNAVYRYTKDERVLKLIWKGLSADYLTVVSTEDDSYQIELGTGEFLIAGQQQALLPQIIHTDPHFQELFPDIQELTGLVRSGGGCQFKDRLQIHYWAWMQGKRVRIAKKVDSILYQFEPNSLAKEVNPYLLQHYTFWNTAVDSGTRTLVCHKETKRIVYYFDSKTEVLEWLDGAPYEGLHTKALSHPTALKFQKLFKQFDPAVQIWLDKASRVAFIQSPHYRLLFEVCYQEQERPSLKSCEFLGYRLSGNQSLSPLIRLSGYLILEKINREEDRLLLLPKRELLWCADLTKPLELSPSETYYFYQIGPKDALSNDSSYEARFYLAHLYLILGRYERARQLLCSSFLAIKQGLYTKEERALLLDIVAGNGKRTQHTRMQLQQQADADVHAVALRLKTWVLVSDNYREWGSSLSQEDQRYVSNLLKTFSAKAFEDYQVYLSIYTRLSSKFLLTHEEHTRCCTLFESGKFPYAVSDLDKVFPTHADWVIQMKVSEAWMKSAVSVRSVVDDKERWMERTENAFIQEFSHLYSIARLRNPGDGTLRDTLRFRLPLVCGETEETSNKIRPLIRILQACLEASEKTLEVWPLPALISKQLASIIGKVNAPAERYSEIASLLRPLLQLSGPYWLAHEPKSHNAEGRRAVLKAHQFQHVIDLGLLEAIEIQFSASDLSGIEKSRALATIEQESILKRSNQVLILAKEERTLAGEKTLGRLEAMKKEFALTALDEQELAALIDDLRKSSSQHSATPTWRLNRQGILGMKQEVEEYLDKNQDRIEGLQRWVMNLINRLPKEGLERLIQLTQISSGKKSRVRFSDLFLPFLRKDPGEYRALNLTLTQQEISALQSSLTQYFIFATWKQHLFRIKHVIESIEAMGKQRSEAQEQEMATKLAMTLQAKREYVPYWYPEYLLFEHHYDLLLRKDQVQQMEDLIATRHWKVTEILMGKGKTLVLMTLLALKIAKGKHLAMVMFPEQLFASMIDALQIRLGRLFGLKIHCIPWKTKESHLLTTEDLTNIISRLQQIKRSKEVLVVSDADMHSFNLAATKAQMDAQSGTTQSLLRLMAFQAILRFFKSHGFLLIDEVDSCLRPDFETHRSLEDSVRLDPARVLAVHLLYDTLLEEFGGKVRFEFYSKEGSHPYTMALYEKTIKPKLIERLSYKLTSVDQLMVNYGRELAGCCEGLEKQRALIQNYLVHKRVLPGTLSERTKDLLAFLWFEIHTLLPHTLDKVHGSRYGRFPVGHRSLSQLAGPYRAGSPCLGAQFGLYAEQINYTLQAYHKEGVQVTQVWPVLLHLQESARQAARWEGIEVEKTEAYAEYRKLFDPKGELELFRNSPDSIGEMVKGLNKQDPLRLHRFVSHYVLNQLTLPARRIRSDGYRLPEMMEVVKGMSGTLTAQRQSLHPRFQVQLDPGIQGRVIACLLRDERVRCVKKEDPLEIVQELLTADRGKELLAFLDLGALLMNVPMRKVAERVLLLRPDLEGVIFYEEDLPKMMKRTLGVGGKAGTLVFPYQEDLDINLSKRFTIYDYKRCLGADIPQAWSAQACLTLGKGATLRDLAQAMWRMRGIEQAQRVMVVLTQEMADLIDAELGKKQGIPLTIYDVLLYTVRCQAQKRFQDTMKSLKQQLEGQWMIACHRILAGIGAADLVSAPFRSLSQFLAQEMEDHPYRQYGGEESMHSQWELLQGFSQSLFHRFRQWQEAYAKIPSYQHYDKLISLEILLAKKKTEEILSLALERGLISKQVSGQRIDLGQEIGVCTEIHQEQSIVATLNRPEEEEQILLPRLGWDLSSLIFSEEYLILQKFDAAAQQSIVTWALEGKPFRWRHGKILGQYPPVVKANHLLALHPAASDLNRDPLFSDQLEVSLNLLYRVQGKGVLGGVQRVRDCALIIVTSKGVRLFLLENGEANFILRELRSDRTQSPWKRRDHKLGLYNYKLGAKDLGLYQTGYEGIKWKEIEAFPESFLLFVQYKFFCGELSFYTKEELKALEEWLRRQPDLNLLETFFKNQMLTSDQRRIYARSPVAQCFARLQGR